MDIFAIIENTKTSLQRICTPLECAASRDAKSLRTQNMLPVVTGFLIGTMVCWNHKRKHCVTSVRAMPHSLSAQYSAIVLF